MQDDAAGRRRGRRGTVLSNLERLRERVMCFVVKCLQRLLFHRLFAGRKRLRHDGERSSQSTLQMLF